MERASRAGTLTAASLMVAAPAAEDAVRRARALPGLRVGLHLVLADGAALLERHLIPALVDRDGRMDGRMFARGLRYFALPGVRRQLDEEIRAQFTAFARSGLALDHVNVHKHFHLHPSLLELIIRIGGDFGMRAVRIPDEPLWFAARGGAWITGPVSAALLTPWIGLMKHRLRRHGILHNDQVFGIACSGAMTEARLLEILARLPDGVTEIYLHPATESGSAIAASMDGYRHAEELAALLSPRVRSALAAAAPRGGFSDLPHARGSWAA